MEFILLLAIGFTIFVLYFMFILPLYDKIYYKIRFWYLRRQVKKLLKADTNSSLKTETVNRCSSDNISIGMNTNTDQNKIIRLLIALAGGR